MPHIQRDDEVLYMIDVVNKEGQGLTKWERDFIKRITFDAAFTGKLSPKQRTILQRLYEEKTPESTKQ